VTLTSIDGHIVSYLDAGSGPAVLMIHGWTADGGDWVYQVPALVDAGYRVIVPDLRGHGGSEPGADGYDLLASAQRWVRLLDHLGLERATVMGHSYGAAIGATIAAEHPDRCAGLVLVDGAYGREAEVVDQMAAHLLPALASPQAVDAVTAMVAGLHAPTSRADLVTWHTRRARALPVAVSRHMVGAMLDDPRSPFLREQAEKLIARIASPVLAVHAASSVHQCEWERACLVHERSEVHGWDDVGHWLQLERPERFNTLLLAWMGSIGAKELAR
jgi:pimeloyl-ACP methyl ester carboxylesterase